jgi:creatinine amidohydrolase
MSRKSASVPQGVLVARASWPLVEAALEAGASGVLPIGAAAKAHGRHLPMNTDLLQAEWLATRLAGARPVCVWPSLGYGYYPAFVDYPGSCSLPRETFIQTVVALLDDMLRAGCEALVVLNTGISTIEPLEAGRRGCRAPKRVRLAHVYRGRHYLAAERRVRTQPRGGHADELETSIMLAIAPEVVHMDEARACFGEMTPGPFNRTDPERPNYAPHGVYGDPCAATREKGKVLLQAMVKDLLDLLE